MSAKEDFIKTLKEKTQLRGALNLAFHDLFDEAGIIGLSKDDKVECIGALKDYIWFDNNYDNVHVHWSS